MLQSAAQAQHAVAADGSVDNLRNFIFEFQPIAHAVPAGGSPRVERRGPI